MGDFRPSNPDLPAGDGGDPRVIGIDRELPGPGEIPEDERLFSRQKPADIVAGNP